MTTCYNGIVALKNGVDALDIKSILEEAGYNYFDLVRYIVDHREMVHRQTARDLAPLKLKAR